jgi:hypothetical protein
MYTPVQALSPAVSSSPGRTPSHLIVGRELLAPRPCRAVVAFVGAPWHTGEIGPGVSATDGNEVREEFGEYR